MFLPMPPFWPFFVGTHGQASAQKGGIGTVRPSALPSLSQWTRWPFPHPSVGVARTRFEHIGAVEGTSPDRKRTFRKVVHRRNMRVVIKVGTSSLMLPEGLGGGGLRVAAIAKLCEVVAQLQREGAEVVLVSSGAVGIGARRCGLDTRPTDLAARQALAAVGQVHLMRFYDELLSAVGGRAAQVLLTLENLAKRSQWSSARATFDALFAIGAVPIVNENDTVAVDELRVGDNDTLAAHVASMVEADWLFLLTDVDAIYTADPRTCADAKPIRTVTSAAQLHALSRGNASVRANNESKAQINQTHNQRKASSRTPKKAGDALADQASSMDLGKAETEATDETGKHGTSDHKGGQEDEEIKSLGIGGSGSGWGTGGMETKVTAATIATAAGVKVVVCNAREPEKVADAVRGEEVGTLFLAQPRPLRQSKRWILSIPPAGTVVVDGGAVSAMREKRKSLFAAGIVRIDGHFASQQAIRIVGREDGVEFARGLTNFSSEDLHKVKGCTSADFFEQLGYHASSEVVHRDQICLLDTQ